MVANVVICPACRKHLKAREPLPLGKHVTCTGCGQHFFPMVKGERRVPTAPPVAQPVLPGIPLRPWLRARPGMGMPPIVVVIVVAALVFGSIGVTAGYFAHRPNNAARVRSG